MLSHPDHDAPHIGFTGMHVEAPQADPQESPSAEQPQSELVHPAPEVQPVEPETNS